MVDRFSLTSIVLKKNLGPNLQNYRELDLRYYKGMCEIFPYYNTAVQNNSF